MSDVDIYADCVTLVRDTKPDRLSTELDDVDVLYGDVPISSSSKKQDVTAAVPHEAAAAPSSLQRAFNFINPTRRFSLYVGNLTWWTSDQDLTEALSRAGVDDLVEIKFYENRVNGQSKGFAMVTLASEESAQKVLTELPKSRLHDHFPVVTACTKTALREFEAAAPSRPDVPPSQPQQQQWRREEAEGLPPIQVALSPPSLRSEVAPQPAMPAPSQLIQHPLPQCRPRPVAGLNFPLPVGFRPPTSQPYRSGPPPRSFFGPPIRPGPPAQVPPGSATFPPYPCAPPLPPNHFVPPNVRPPLPPLPPLIVPPGAPAPHINPAFLSVPPGGFPPSAFPHHRPALFPSPAPVSSAHVSAAALAADAISEVEKEEHLRRNKQISSNAISRAVQDASQGDYGAAIETLVTAISLIKQSRVHDDHRCKILLSSLQDTLGGIEARSYGKAKSRSPAEAERKRRRREKSRSGERDCYAGAPGRREGGEERREYREEAKDDARLREEYRERDYYRGESERNFRSRDRR